MRVLSLAQLTRRAHQPSSRKFQDPAVDRSRCAPLCSWEYHVPHQSYPESLGLSDVRQASVHASSQLFSALFGSLLPGRNCLPPKKKTFLQQASGIPSLEEEEEEEEEEEGEEEEK